MDRDTPHGELREGDVAPAKGQDRPFELEVGGVAEDVTAKEYVVTVLDCYTGLPDTPDRPRKNDRSLAQRLYEQRVPLQHVRAAFLLATSRRWFRPADADPLEPIRSLHYFVPVIDELRHTPPPSVYVELLRGRLRTGFPAIGVRGLPQPIPW